MGGDLGALGLPRHLELPGLTRMKQARSALFPIFAKKADRAQAGGPHLFGRGWLDRRRVDARGGLGIEKGFVSTDDVAHRTERFDLAVSHPQRPVAESR